MRFIRFACFSEKKIDTVYVRLIHFCQGVRVLILTAFMPRRRNAINMYWSHVQKTDFFGFCEKKAKKRLTVHPSI